MANALQIGNRFNVANLLLCSRCGFSALTLNRSKVFCSFLWVAKKYFTFSCVYQIYDVYLHEKLK